jgi:hypothetical protein
MGTQQAQQPNQRTSEQQNQPSPNWWTWFSDSGANWVIATLTMVLSVIGVLQWWTTRTTNKHYVVIERAYLTLSHSPPGIKFSDDVIALVDDEQIRNPAQNATVRIGIKNYGNTPASVSRILVQVIFTDEQLPPTPQYDETFAKDIRVSVVKTETVFTRHNWPVDFSAIEKTKAGTIRLYVVGYVDYRDQFGERHRSGYARVFEPSIDQPDSYWKESDRSFDHKAFDERNNLPFVTQSGYNYDRKRKRGEGDDWDDPE